MKINELFPESGVRPVIALALCTCIVFSAAAGYVPGRRASADVTSAETEETETVPVSSEETTKSEETDATEAPENIPAPYKLNLASMYEEGAEQSYAEILMKELVRKDSRWYAEIYDMAGTPPVSLARRFGRKAESVMGQYNPASQSQDPNDPATWAVEHFKNVKVSFSGGSGGTSSAVSNAQDILSMASVYAYFNNIEDLDTIRSYVNSLWSASHSYSASMGDVYYCEGCVSPDAVHGGGDEDAELSGEDTFNENSTINTEIMADGESSSEEESGSEDALESSLDGLASSGPKNTESGSHGGAVIVPTETAATRTTAEWEATTSVLDSLAETAESVYVEETTRRALIVRPDETTGSEEVRKPGPKPEESSEIPGTSETTGSKEAESTASEDGAGGNDADAAGAAAEAEAVLAVPDTARLLPAADADMEYRVQAAAVSSGEQTAPSPAKVCPGHIDLKISAKILTLAESDSLYKIDQKGNAVEEGSGWNGWDEQNTAYVSHIARQNWTEDYGLNIVVEGTRAPLSGTEVESYMKLLPESTSEVRKDIIRFALQSVGKVPYHWGGKPNAKNYSGNNFGSVTIPDHKGRILKGLDCSGWVNWVYWSVTGNRLPYEGTEGLRTMGRQVNRKDLKPGDIVVITGNTPHVIMFLGWTSNGQIQCIHETGSANNVTVGVMNANWPYYRNLLD